jgi:hypothetical protein
LRFLGPGHPKTCRDEDPVGWGRVVVGILGLAVFVLSLTPDPFPGAWGLFGQIPGALMDLLRSYFGR